MRNSVGSFLKVFLPVAFFLLVGIYSAYLYEKKVIFSKLESQQLAHVNSAKKYINDRLHQAVLDLYFLAQQKEIKEYLRSGDEEVLDFISPVFLGMSHGGKHYEQLSLLNAEAKEKVRIDWRGNHAQLVDADNLLDLSSHYYIKQLATKPQGELHISYLDHDGLGEAVTLRLSVKFRHDNGNEIYLVLALAESVFDAVQDLIYAGKTDVLVINHEGVPIYSSGRYIDPVTLAGEVQSLVMHGFRGHSLDGSKDAYRLWKGGELWTYVPLGNEEFKAWKVYMLLPSHVVHEETRMLGQRFKVTFLSIFLVGLLVSFLYVRAVSKADRLSDENKKIAGKISEKESLLSLFITHVPAAVAMVDKDMRYIAVSNRWLEDFRLMDNVIGSSHYEIFPEMPMYWRSVYERCFEGGVEHCDEEQLMHSDGVMDWVRWEVRPWYTAENDIGGLVMLMEVITSRKQAGVARDEFVSKVSHELRTPLTAIMGSMKLLQANVFGKLDSQAAEVLSIAERNSQRLLDLVNNLLDMQKIRIGDIEFALTDGSVRPIVEQAIKQVSEVAKDKDITIVLKDESDSAHVCVDEMRLIQVVNHLLSNAIKHSPASSEIEVEITRLHKEVMVSVADSGSGVAEEIKRDIFNEFVQSEEGNKRTPGGTGLGLAIAKALIDKLGGNISFYNQDKGGAVFYFTLPEVVVSEGVQGVYVSSSE